MAGLETSSRKPGGKDSSLEYLILAGLLAGFGLFLLMSSRQNSDGPASDPVPARTVAQTKAETPPVVRSNRDAVDRNEPANAEDPVPERIPRKNLTRRLEAFAAERARHPLAAIAAKSTVPIKTQVDANDPTIKRPEVTEASLRSELTTSVPVMGLDPKQALAANDVVLKTKTFGNRPDRPLEGVLSLLPEEFVDSLPFAKGGDCRLDETSARSLDEHAKDLHSQLSLTDQSIARRYPVSAKSRRDPAMIRAIEKGDWQDEDAIPALLQILQVETEPVREHLIEMAAKHRTGKATELLVNRAVFDLSPKVRLAATNALKSRSADDYRGRLLESLRYPWPPAAWNAAETLVALDDQKAVPGLIKLLKAPDPTKPHRDKSGNLIVKELVRIHHMQNCLLCHAPAEGKEGVVRGKVPDGRVAVVPTGGRGRSYYRQQRAVRPDDVFVRAELTYLRQDFSLTEATGRTGQLATRFDYLVRSRKASEEEIAAAMSADTAPDYPQREAVLYALQNLTGENPGIEPKDWLALRE